MSKARSSETVTLYGRAASTTADAIGGLGVTAVSCEDILQQFSCTTDETGQFTLEVPAGSYDLICVDESHMPLILAGIAVDRDRQRDIVVPVSNTRATAMQAVICLPDGTPASELTAELHDGTASNCLATFKTGKDGRLEIADCPPGYHLLIVHGSDGEEYMVPVPQPN
jgi:hypothetical protein